MLTIPPKFTMVVIVWVTLVSLSIAQPRNPETPEPPLADPNGNTVPPSKFDPDEKSGIAPAQYVVPGRPIIVPSSSPTRLPGSVVNPGTLTVGAGEVLPYETIPTPMVTLNIEGANDAPSGQPVIFKLTVRNISRAKAHNVVLRVTPPKNATKVKADPPPTIEEAETRWELKVLEPNQSRTIEVSYLPKAENDDIKILARVQFDFGRGMVTHVSAPALTINKEGPETMVMGDTAVYRITVKNTGKVTIRDIEVQEKLDRGLVYDTREMARGTVDGKLMAKVDAKTGDRSWPIRSLAPGQSQVIEYRVKAEALGRKLSMVHVKYPGSPQEPKHKEFEVEVLSASLEMQATGPAELRGVVGQGASYKVVVMNRGSAVLRNVSVRCVFPADMRVVRATQNGQPFRDHVQWIFKEMKPGDVQEVSVALSTNAPGARLVQFFAKADKGNEQKSEIKTEFGGLPSLSWDTEVPGVGTVGKRMTYTVTVMNSGTAAAKRVQLRMDLPPNVDLLNTVPGAGRGTGANARQVIFAAQEVPAGKKTTFTIDVTPRSEGEARAIFQLYSETTGNEPAEHRKSTTITDTNQRGPGGPPPKIDPSKVGYPPG